VIPFSPISKIFFKWFYYKLEMSLVLLNQYELVNCKCFCHTIH